jgi:hypothetical protein
MLYVRSSPFLFILFDTLFVILLLLFLPKNFEELDIQAYALKQTSSEHNQLNVIIGRQNITRGTDQDDVIIACPNSVPVCSQGDMLYGKRGDDVLQGSIGDDSLYGDDGKDSLIGADGNDKIYGGQGSDVLFGGFGSDLLVAGPGNDELYAGPQDDVLIGGPGADYFDCGDGQDVILDFNPAQGDTHADNCEVILNHNPNDIHFILQPDSSSATISGTLNTITAKNDAITNTTKSPDFAKASRLVAARQTSVPSTIKLIG